MKKLLSYLLLLPIYFYQKCISPLTSPSCRFTPTCSQYAVEAIYHGCIPTEYQPSVCGTNDSGKQFTIAVPGTWGRRCVCISTGIIMRIVQKIVFLWNGIISGTSPGVAAQNTSDCQIQPFERSMFLYRFNGILRSGRSETT